MCGLGLTARGTIFLLRLRPLLSFPTPILPLVIDRNVHYRTGYSVMLMHRDKDYWGEDALEFDPQRWYAIFVASREITHYADALSRLDDRLARLTANPFMFLPFNGSLLGYYQMCCRHYKLTYLTIHSRASHLPWAAGQSNPLLPTFHSSALSQSVLILRIVRLQRGLLPARPPAPIFLLHYSPP